MMEMTAMIYENYLNHHGILGQKWGVRNGTNYPLKPSQHSAAEKKAYSSGNRGGSIAKYKAKVAKKSQMKTVKKEEHQQKIAEKKATKDTALKAKVLKSRSISKLYKNANLFTDQELRQLKDRYILEGDIKKLKNTNYTQRGRDFVDKVNLVSDGLGKVANMVDNGTKTYNNVAKVMNSLYGSDMPIIGEKKENHKKEVEYTTTTRTKDSKGQDVTIVKKWKE